MVAEVVMEVTVADIEAVAGVTTVVVTVDKEMAVVGTVATAEVEEVTAAEEVEEGDTELWNAVMRGTAL